MPESAGSGLARGWSKAAIIVDVAANPRAWQAPAIIDSRSA
jgi:hypothetical protein